MLIKSCCLLLFIFSECLTTKITRLEVPPEMRLGSPEAADVLLDCQYELESDEGLVVGWYFNRALVYQWIKGGETSARGILKDHLDLTYNVSGLPTQLYRAMRILNPIPEFSGDYICKVSTYDSEDVEQKHMQFYDPGDGPTLSYTVTDGNQTAEDSDSVVTLECAVSGVFPQPELTITVDGQVVNQTQANVNTTEGRYNASAVAGVPVAEMATGTEVQCDLTLPYTTYNSSILLTYTDVEVTSEGPAAAESALPAAVGAGSPWAAGSVGSLQASLALLLVGLAASFRDLTQLRCLRQA